MTGNLATFERAHRLVTLALEPNPDTVLLAQETIELGCDELAYTCFALARLCVHLIEGGADLAGVTPEAMWRELLADWATKAGL